MSRLANSISPVDIEKGPLSIQSRYHKTDIFQSTFLLLSLSCSFEILHLAWFSLLFRRRISSSGVGDENARHNMRVPIRWPPRMTARQFPEEQHGPATVMTLSFSLYVIGAPEEENRIARGKTATLPTYCRSHLNQSRGLYLISTSQ